MELRNENFINRKRILNGSLPRFADGMPIGPTGNPYGWNPSLTYDNLVASTLPKARTPITQNVAPEQGPITKDGITAAPHYFDNKKTSSDNSASGISPWFALGSWLGGGTLEGLGLVLKSPGDIAAEQQTSMNTINGVLYQQTAGLDLTDYKHQYNKSTGLDFLTNPARGITKLFGHDHAMRLAELARQRIQKGNNQALSVAATQGLLIENAKEYGDTRNQVLYSAANGKSPIYSAFGPSESIATARVSNGETIVSPDGSAYVVPGKPNNKDTKLAHITDGDAILSNHGASQYFKQTGDIAGALRMDENRRNMLEIGYKNGKLPCYNEGMWGNAIIHGIGAAMNLGQLIDAYTSKKHRVDVRLPQGYMGWLPDLYDTRVSVFPTLNQLYRTAANSNYDILMSPGLSTAQKQKSRTANLMATLNAISNALFNNLIQNNQYRTNGITTYLDNKNKVNTLNQTGTIFNTQDMNSVNAAQKAGIYGGLEGLLKQSQSYLSNYNKLKQFQDTYALYAAQNKLDLDKYNYWLETGKYYGQ